MAVRMDDVLIKADPCSKARHEYEITITMPFPKCCQVQGQLQTLAAADCPTVLCGADSLFHAPPGEVLR